MCRFLWELLTKSPVRVTRSMARRISKLDSRFELEELESWGAFEGFDLCMSELEDALNCRDPLTNALGEFLTRWGV